jgi:1-deoxy-D-xylulose-5-phosphate reductoisomerase
MSVKRVAILGSTGSVGRSALDVIVAHPGHFEVTALTAGRNLELLVDQIRRFRPRYVAVASEQEAQSLTAMLPSPGVEIGYGQEGLTRAAALRENDIVLNALVGSVGLLASLETIKLGKPLALANKESLVVGGALFEPLATRTGAKILPVDSEHSAIWQCLTGGKLSEVRQVWLTASGGPFRERNRETFSTITVDEALAHPTWKMGP